MFDQRAAEKIAHRADLLGFDAISAGGVVTWIMECLNDGVLAPSELGITRAPRFALEGFSVEADSMHNAETGIEILDAIASGRGALDFGEGARKFARRFTGDKRRAVLDRFVYTASGRRGWMVPNQYWTPGVLAPMAIMGKYYMHYGKEFMPPRELGRACADRLKKELVMDNLGTCRFHRGWAEDMLPDIVENLFGMKEKFLENAALTAVRINALNRSVPWESARNVAFVRTFLERKRDVEGSSEPELLRWIDAFAKDASDAALSFWYEIHRGINEVLRQV